MQAVILAGGLGTRLWPLTKEIPKPMAPVAGAPYLEHQLRLLEKQGITEILLLTGYLGEQIEDYFGDGSPFGLSIRYSRESAPIGTGGALREATALLASEFLVIYGDSLLPMDYHSVMAELTRAEGVLVVYDNRHSDTSVDNNIALDDEGFVSRYAKGTRDPELKFVDAGVLAFRRSVLERIPEDGVVSLEKEVYPELIKRRQLIGLETRQRFFDIGTPERLRAIEKFLLHDYHANAV